MRLWRWADKEEVMPTLMSEGRARMIASETPMTWQQVMLLGYQATEERPGWEMRQWLLWGNHQEVGEYLFDFWMDRGGEDWAEEDLRHLDEIVSRGTRGPKDAVRERYLTSGGAPATARAVGQSAGRMSCSAHTGWCPSSVEASSRGT